MKGYVRPTWVSKMVQLNPFEQRNQDLLKSQASLAERMRPNNLEEFVGQHHLLGSGRILHRIVTHNTPQSFILWGPPGSGKTTLARIIARQTEGHLISMSAVSAGTREIRSAVEEAREVWAKHKKRTWLFMDEIHRLNKAQQDTMLPFVESGVILLLGATTENPSFEVIRPLLSRAQVLVLEPLRVEDLEVIIQRALTDPVRGLGKFPAKISQEAGQYLYTVCSGDARIALNALEIAVLTTVPGSEGVRWVELQTIKDALQYPMATYDKTGEQHYNLISALHKSIRGSDPDAALYWLARMMEGGEAPLYIARRLVRVALEDIGLADPDALLQVNAVVQTYQMLGSPEGDLALAQAVVYLALAPKSNSVYRAYAQAIQMAKRTPSAAVPLHLRNAPTDLMKKFGYGKDYRYPHDHPEGWIVENYFPEVVKDFRCYDPTERGWEGQHRLQLEERRFKLQKWRARKNE